MTKQMRVFVQALQRSLDERAEKGENELIIMYDDMTYVPGDDHEFIVACRRYGLHAEMMETPSHTGWWISRAEPKGCWPSWLRWFK